MVVSMDKYMDCADWKVRVNRAKDAITKLKKDIKTLQKNVCIAEILLDSVKCEESFNNLVEFISKMD